MPGPRRARLWSVPDSRAVALGAAVAGGLRIVPPAADQDGHDGGAAAGFGATGVVTAGGDAMTTGPTDCLKRCLDLLGAAVVSAPGELALAGFPAAADFAGLAEEISRGAEYLQLLGAAAVDRTRTEAINAAGPASKAAGWTTGWGTGTDDGTEAAAASGSAASSTSVSVPVPAVSPADDGSRNTAEFLRTRLRISAGEARRRLALASAILPRTGITGQPMPPAYEETAAALATGTIASRAGTIITTALDRVRHLAAPADLARMEHTLTRTAIQNDHDFLTRIAHRWADAIDQDGTEPTEEDLRHRQGAFLRRPRRGLHHLEIFATPDQYEHLLTVMNTATNPRTQPTPGPDAGTSGDSGDSGAAGTDSAAGNSEAARAENGATTDTPTDTDDGTDDGRAAGPHTGPGFGEEAETAAADAPLERRTRPQQLLDGLIGACKAALATGTLPATGGLRPQVMVTISYQDLLNRLETASTNGPRYTTGNPSPTRGNHPSLADGPAFTAGHPASPTGHLPAPTADGPPGTATGTGTFTFTGPVTPATIRKIACDADIIPVLLGSEGRILDIGRTTRIFPPHIRKAITARDQGCAFPNCTIPAPWCEAHHTTYWSHGGPTNTDNGTLLCTHHHHLIHKEQWQIRMQTGVPWFIPPPHIDPKQTPRRNHHHRT
ncbi:DUF222 domain-containing protein [Arthrobacter sp. ISL-5]|nr:DUF222 domain-containing protein [Arthrobacter sp. ISL-5]